MSRMCTQPMPMTICSPVPGNSLVTLRSLGVIGTLEHNNCIVRTRDHLVSELPALVDHPPLPEQQPPLGEGEVEGLEVGPVVGDAEAVEEDADGDADPRDHQDDRHLLLVQT